MIVSETILSLRDALKPARLSAKRIGLVPTMGALHEGHRSLIQQARSACDVVVTTIFVNPTQFGPNEDLDRYPRTFDQDLATCKDAGVDIVFAPESGEMYPQVTLFLSIGINELTDHLCGATRPGHFNGVLQIVNKLLNIVQPTDAWFGQKDIQQLILLETMVREFNIPVEIHRGTTIREADGLAMSSRNRYLTEEERAVAPALFAEITSIRDFLKREKTVPEDELHRLLSASKYRLTEIGFKIDYLSIVDLRNLQPQHLVYSERMYIIAVAAWLGKTRLIDNIII